MQASNLNYYLKNPSQLKQENVKELQQLVHDFPYFQSAHILLSLASKKWDASVYQQSLKKSAIVVSNRSHLFQLIHKLEERSEDILENEPGKILNTLAENQEEIKQELSILKAAEISANTEKSEILKEKQSEKENQNEKQNTADQAQDMLEKEIQSQVVTAFVEKELLKTPEFNKTINTQATPENFSEWLSLMKKNNGQSLVFENETSKKDEIDTKQDQVKVEQVKNEENEQKTIDLEEKQALDARKLKNRAIIDKIIEKSPGLIRQKEEQKFYTPDIKAKESLIENEHLVTETLAKIYALQGNIGKAVRAYEILSLKYPQKSAYFAALIQKLKNN